jgi:hypothetical protein
MHKCLGMENSYYKLYSRRTQYIVFGSIVFLCMILAVSTGSSSYASRDAYNSGYVHGCYDAGISDPDDRYINRPGKGPSFHTISFMNGYNDGFYLCSSNSEPGIQS